MNGTPDHSALKIPVSLVAMACLAVMACLVGLVAAACAREGMPPGGPRDRIPPWVVETDPPAGSTHVPLDVTPTLTFSERIQPRSIEGNLFIAPIVEFEAEPDWRGNEITVRFEEPLLADRTYIITVGTGIRDMRSNRMDSTYVYALSTGSSIEEGEVSGMTVHDGQPARNTYIWAYNLTGKPNPDPAGTTRTTWSRPAGTAPLRLPISRPAVTDSSPSWTRAETGFTTRAWTPSACPPGTSSCRKRACRKRACRTVPCGFAWP